MKNDVYEPIKRKIREWIEYDENAPKVAYSENPELHDDYRKAHDRDCILTGGNLYADTLFSLWLPLRNTIRCLNDEQSISAVGNIYDKISFVRALMRDDNLEKLLPEDKSVVTKLSTLFELGMRRENVMILPDRRLNPARAQKPYWDYVPVFLLESFPGGGFASYWNGLDDYIEWIRTERLEMLFGGEPVAKNIKDLAGTGDLRITIPNNGFEGMERLLDNYLQVLRERQKYFM